MRLQDKVVVITGAGHGLGRESARLFASEGAKIVATDLVDTHVKTLADEINGSGGTAVATKADVTSEDDMLAAVQTAVDSFGRLDVMFCNAGIPEVGFGTVEFVDTTLENWNRVIAVNLTGVFLGAKAAAKQFLAQGKKRYDGDGVLERLNDRLGYWHLRCERPLPPFVDDQPGSSGQPAR